MTDKARAVDPKLLEILRCPVAVHYKDRGEDAGKLTLVRDGYWLYSPDSGYKYPVIEGIPKMLAEEGARWQDTAVDDLPVPPPNEPLISVAEEALSPEMQALADNLQARASDIRSEVAQKLTLAAQEIRSQATNASGSVVSRQAEALAGELEAEAQRMGGQPTAPAPATSQPVWQLGVLFVVGLVLGRLFSRRRKS